MTLGGYFQAAVQTWGEDNLNGVIGHRFYSDDGSAFAPISADLDTLANINSWTQAFVTIQGGLNGYQTIISQAFVNFGNLSKSPFYLTIGNTDLPFGTFPGGGLVASTVESNAFAPDQLNQLDLGWSRGNFNTTFALFNGQTNLSDFSYSAEYTVPIQSFSLQGGAGYLRDIRYSASDVAAAYGTSNSIYNTRTGILQGGRNGAVDLNASLTYTVNSNQSANLSGEWITTTTSPSIARTNISTGKLQAWSVSGSYSLPIFHRDTTFALDYSATINMQLVPLQLPGQIDEPSFSMIGIQNQWLGYFQTEVLQNIYIGPEYIWLEMYNGQHTWETSLNLSLYL